MVLGLEAMSTSEERHFKMATIEEVAVNHLSLKASVLEKNICDRAPEANAATMSYLEMRNCTATGGAPKQLCQLTRHAYTHVQQ